MTPGAGALKRVQPLAARSTTLRSVRLALGFVLMLSAARAQNVVIVVIDGVRYTESFGGGAATIPGIWQELRPQGMIWEHFSNDGLTYTCPGHASIESGTWQTIFNDGSERPTFPTIFEYFRKESGLAQSTCAVVAGKPKLQVLSYSSHPDYGSDYGATTHIASGDLAVFDSLRSVLAREKPRLVLVNFPGTDFAAHAGILEEHLAALRTADSLTDQIWKLINDDPFYAGTTTLFVTNDHGRHDDEHGGFQAHGDSCQGCRHIMLLAVGRLVKAGLVSTTARAQIDIATTVGWLLGFATPYAQGANLLEDPVTALLLGASALPGAIELQAYPNPFNGSARLIYMIPKESHVQLALFDLLGRRVRTFKDGPVPAGRHTVIVDAGDLPSGIYAIRLTSGQFLASSRMLLVK